MPKNVLGLFDSQAQAHQAVTDLLAMGFPTNAISVVATDPGGRIARHTVDESGDMASAGAVAGGASGLILGGLLGLLVGATTLAAPPVGAVIAGPVAGMIAGAGIGVVGGTILGALIGLGIPEEEVHVYAESIRRGSVLVSANVPDGQLGSVEALMARNGAVDIRDRAAAYRSEGFTTFDPNAPIYTEEQAALERQRLAALPATTVVTETVPTVAAAVPPVVTTTTTTIEDATPIAAPSEVPPPVGTGTAVAAPTSEDETYFQSDFASRYPSTIGTFATYQPAYHYGYELASRAPFAGQPWDMVEANARSVWEARNPGTWDRFRDVVHTGWLRANAASPIAVPKARVL